MQIGNTSHRTSAVAIAGLSLVSQTAMAGPPFLTDDPVPVDFRHGELYAFSTYDEADGGTESSLPGFECNYGVLPDTQLHLMLPFARVAPDHGSSELGIGDVEIGVKYRFIHESAAWPQVAVFPMAMLPTGNSKHGLGNGKTWWRLPVWAQKSWGEWTTYGGGGYVINSADGQTNYAFGGWLLERDLGEKWTLGGEVFARDKDTVGGTATTIVNLGGLYKFSRELNLLFSAGHDVSGEHHAVAYLGLWWGFGSDATDRQSSNPPPRNQWSNFR